jgi:hypothetical protein
MQRKQQVGECWVCVIFFACVCVGVSDSTIASDDPKFLLSLCHVCWALPRGVPGEAMYGPPWLHVAFRATLEILFWEVFSIFSSFLN